MSTLQTFEVREYQQAILSRTFLILNDGFNVLIELDCGLGKRFLQYSLLNDVFKKNKILLILQASTSLYETFNFIKTVSQNNEIGIIDSRMPSVLRFKELREKRVIISLPQTLMNTIKQYPDSINTFEIIIINEVDQIIKRTGTNNSLKHPYLKLMDYLANMKIIGMSGTLRDDHYIINNAQIKIKKELLSLIEILGNAQLISMESIMNSDIEKYGKLSEVAAVAVQDDRISLISLELEQYIDDAKLNLMAELKNNAPELYYQAKKDFSILFRLLPVEDKIMKQFHSGYLIRKYLWAMNGEKSKFHLIRYGLDESYVKNTLPMLPGKFMAVKELIKFHKKSVILCSYLDTVETLYKLICANNISVIKITGKIPQQERTKYLQDFRESDNQMAALLSNVGERDLDIPEADLLIVFDLIRTPKTVYQKFKRSRGGKCKILYYQGTKEKQKVDSVLQNIQIKYPWSTIIQPPEKIYHSTPNK